jgi:hypothetical protein
MSALEKASLLYKHIWFSDLTLDTVREFYRHKRYHEVISHDNFNPRIVDFITQQARVDDCDVSDYWERVLSLLQNPKDVWKHLFEAQLDHFGRIIVLLVVLSRGLIKESELAGAYARFLQMQEVSGSKGERDFQIQTAHLVGAVVNRTLATDANSEPIYSPFNPSVADFVLHRYPHGDFDTFIVALDALRSVTALITLNSLANRKTFSSERYCAALDELIARAANLHFKGYSPEYLTALASYRLQHSNLLKPLPSTQNLKNLGAHVLDHMLDAPSAHAIRITLWLAEAHALSSAQLVAIAETQLGNGVRDKEDIVLATTLLARVERNSNERDTLRDIVETDVLDYLSDQIEELVADNNLFFDVDEESYSHAEEKVHNFVRDLLREVNLDSSLADKVTSKVSVRSLLDEHHEPYEDSFKPTARDKKTKAERALIDDLFVRDDL